VKLVGKNQKSLVGADPPLNPVNRNASLSHQVKDEDKSMMGIGIEAPALQFLRRASGK
jgi:hypothetical protein